MSYMFGPLVIHPSVDVQPDMFTIPQPVSTPLTEFIETRKNYHKGYSHHGDQTQLVFKFNLDSYMGEDPFFTFLLPPSGITIKHHLGIDCM